MIRPLDTNRIRMLRENARRYAGLDLTSYVSSFYQYGRGDRQELGNHDFAVTTEEDGGRIYLETPLTDKLCPKCLSFIVLHELAHVKGVSDHRRATDYAIALLKKQGAAGPEWVNSLKRRWILANNIAALNDTAHQVLEDAGMTRKQIGALYAKSNAALKRGESIPLRLDRAFDDAKIRLLCKSVLPDEMKKKISELGSLGVDNPDRVKPTKHALAAWDRLISEWIDDSTLPLYVRKPSLGRGSEIRHPGGRILVPTDNSPA